MTATVPASSCLAAAVVVIPISSRHYSATRRVATLTRRRRRRRPSNPPPRGTRGLGGVGGNKTKDASAHLVEPQPVAKSLPLRSVHVLWHAGDLDGYAPRLLNGAPPIQPIFLTREAETPHVSSGIIPRRVHFSFVVHCRIHRNFNKKTRLFPAAVTEESGCTVLSSARLRHLRLR